MLVEEQKQKRHWLRFRTQVTGKSLTYQYFSNKIIANTFRSLFDPHHVFITFMHFSLQKCQLLLERSDSAYSQLLATTTLTKLISRTAQVLSLQQRIDISKYFNWDCIQRSASGKIPI